VFDTLITRPWWRPEDLFLHAGARLTADGLVSGTAEAWAARRVAAEAALRAQPGVEEVTLAAIHDRLAAEAGQAPEAARRAEAVEIACELEAIRPIAPMRDEVAALRLAGEPVVMVSDTYFTHATLCDLLRRCEVLHEPALVFASSERGATKRTGRLFGQVAAELGIGPERLSHTGDHPHSDLASPRALGVQATLYTAGAPTRRERLLHAAAAGAPPLMRSALAGSARAARLAAPAEDARRATLRGVGTAVAGPLLAGFVLWTLCEARARGLSRLYFVARDGQVLVRIAEGLLAALGWKIECRYLLGSRQAWHLPALERLDDAALDWLAAPESSEPLHKALARAELRPEAIPDALARHGLAGALDRPPERGRLGALLRDPEVEALVLARAAERRRTALGYLRQEGLFEGGPVAMVDVGWHGRLQRSLHSLLEIGAREAGQPPPPLLGLYLGLVSRPAGLPADHLAAWLSETDQVNPVLLEIFCAADHGTTRHYEDRPEGGFRPVLAEAVDRRVLDWGLATLHDGIATFAAELGAALGRGQHPPERWAAVLRDVALAAFDLFRREPDEAEAEVFGAFPHSDSQTHDSWVDCAPRVGALGRLRLGLGLGDPAYAGHWPEGSVRRDGGALAAGLFGLKRLRRRLQGRADLRPEG
jgi:FMN phosphatase YigB (HAD superfamily)